MEGVSEARNGEQSSRASGGHHKGSRDAEKGRVYMAMIGVVRGHRQTEAIPFAGTVSGDRRRFLQEEGYSSRYEQRGLFWLQEAKCSPLCRHDAQGKQKRIGPRQRRAQRGHQ